jgi:hypothetical protein
LGNTLRENLQPTRALADRNLTCYLTVNTRRASVLGFVAQPSNPNGFVVNRRKPRGLGATSTPIPLITWPPCRPGSVWFCGQTNKSSCSTLWSNRGTQQFSGEPLKTPHASFGLITPSIEPAKPFTFGSRTVYPVLPHSMTWPLPCTGSYLRLRLAFLATMWPALDSVRPLGPSSRAYLSLHSSEVPQG